ncbi:hypothetical protein K525DRAFT_245057 [Schizophyllum commune Loenen D]|nr:hypothetical protein K525DRAFT_245057 [Schizophyllum commune Loenen D]
MDAAPPSSSPRPTREEVQQAAASGNINELLRLLEKYATKDDASPAASLPARPAAPTHPSTEPNPEHVSLDRGTKRAAAPSDTHAAAGSPKRNRSTQPLGEEISDLYDDLDGPGANLAAGRDSLERIMRSVHDRDPDAVARHLAENMQVLQYGLELNEQEDARESHHLQDARELTPAITPLARAMGAGMFPALAAPAVPTPHVPQPPPAPEPAHHAPQGLRIVTTGSTPGPHPFPAGVTASTLSRGVRSDCLERWKKHRGIPFLGSQMHWDNGPVNANAAAKAFRAQFPGLVFTIWTATRDENGLPPPQNVALYFLRTDNEEVIARLAADVHLIRPHITLTFIPLDRGLHPGETWYTNIDGLGLPDMDAWIQHDILEAIQDILRSDQVFRAMVIANRDNIPMEIASEDAPDYIVDTIRVCPLRMALPGGTSFNYAIRIFGTPPTLDVTAFQQIQAHLYALTYTTAYGVGYAHLFDVCGVCTALDHPRGLCPLPSIPGYLGPLPGRELNPAAVASEALVDPALAIGHAHLIGIRTGPNADNQPGNAAPGNHPAFPSGGQGLAHSRGGRGGRGGFQRGRGGARGAARGGGRGRGGNFAFSF